MGYGCILHNNQDIVVAAFFGLLAGKFPTTIVETLKIREALSWLKELQIDHFIVDSDTQIITDSLNNLVPYSSFVGLIVEDDKILRIYNLTCLLLCIYH